MSDPKNELQKLQETLLDIGTGISESLVTLHQQLLKVLNGLNETNQQLKLNEVKRVLEAQPGATPNADTKKVFDDLNQKMIERNKKMVIAELKLKQLQDRGISSPTDAAQADSLKRSLDDLSNQNAEMLKIKKAIQDQAVLQKQILLTGELPPGTDLETAQKTLRTLESDKLKPMYDQSKELKAQLLQTHKLPSQEKEIKAQETSPDQGIKPRIGKVSG